MALGMGLLPGCLALGGIRDPAFFGAPGKDLADLGQLIADDPRRTHSDSTAPPRCAA